MSDYKHPFESAKKERVPEISDRPFGISVFSDLLLRVGEWELRVNRLNTPLAICRFGGFHFSVFSKFIS
jgi:hypothetical protein